MPHPARRPGDPGCRALKASDHTPAGNPAVRPGGGAPAADGRAHRTPAGVPAPHGSAAQPHPPADLLSLPRVSREVAPNLLLAPEAGCTRKIAEGLIRAGCLTASQIERAGTLEDALKTSISDRLGAQDPLRYFHLQAIFSNQTDVEEPNNLYAPRPTCLGTDLNVILELDQVGSVTIGRPLMHAVRGQVRAARMVITVLERTAHDAVPLFSPAVAEWMAQCRHWMGLNNPREVREEYLAMGEHPSQIHVLTEDELYGEMPSWTCNGYRRRQPSPYPASADPDGLLHLLDAWRGRIDPALESALDQLIAAHAVLGTASWRNPETGEVIDAHQDVGQTFCTLMRWSEDDLLAQMFDDWAEDAQQIDMVGIVTTRKIELAHPEKAAEALDNLAQIMAVTRAVDRVFALLDERVNRYCTPPLSPATRQSFASRIA